MGQGKSPIITGALKINTNLSQIYHERRKFNAKVTTTGLSKQRTTNVMENSTSRIALRKNESGLELSEIGKPNIGRKMSKDLSSGKLGIN